MGRASRALVALCLVASAAAMPLHAQEASLTWVPGEWHGNWRATAVLEGPDFIVLGPTFATDFSFRMDALGTTVGSMDDFGGEVTVSDDRAGVFSVDVAFTGCTFGGDAIEVTFTCSVRIHNVFEFNGQPIPVEHRFEITDAPLDPTSVSCSQAHGLRLINRAPIAGTDLAYSVDVAWAAFRTEGIDAIDMRDYVDDHLGAIDSAIAAGDVRAALGLIVEGIDFLENLGNTVSAAEPCNAGTPQQRRNLWGWYEDVVSRVLLLALQQQDNLPTDLLLQALYVGVASGVVSTASYDQSRAADMKTAFEDALKVKVDHVLAQIEEGESPARPNPMTDAELKALGDEVHSIAVAATQYGMPDLYRHIPVEYR